MNKSLLVLLLLSLVVSNQATLVDYEPEEEYLYPPQVQPEPETEAQDFQYNDEYDENDAPEEETGNQDQNQDYTQQALNEQDNQNLDEQQAPELELQYQNNDQVEQSQLQQYTDGESAQDINRSQENIDQNDVETSADNVDQTEAAPQLLKSALGVDHSQLTSVSNFACFKKNGYTFTIIRAWKSYSTFDTNAPTSIKNAKAGGIAVADIGVYAFPCYSTAADKTPEKQIAAMIDGLSKAKSEYSSIWLDIQTNPSKNCGWSKNFNQNCAFTQKLVQAAKKSGKKVGIYTNLNMWTQIMGGANNCSKFKDLPLWYAHYDNKKDFSDFKGFAGWTKPYMKQYKGDTTLCTSGVDLNYRA